MTAETKAKISVTPTGHPAWNKGIRASDEMRAKLSAAHMGHSPWNKGVSPSLETRARQSAAKKGHVASLETRAKMSVAHTNPSLETRAKISAAMTGQVGHPISIETRAKISAALKVVMTDPRVRANLSATHMGALSSVWKGGPRVSTAKKNHKRRALGFIPMNQYFVGSEGHHLNQNDVIYIPKDLHKSVRHNVFTGKNMEQINAKACQWLTEDWT